MTKVIFRKYKSGEIIALFPDEMNYCFCASYMHIGQHSDAYYAYVVRNTKPATQEEYQPLLNELISIGYDDLKICKRR